MKNFGFGLMRLPMNGEEVDIEQVKKMTDRFLEEGFTYFDTAHPYIKGKSETAIREALVKRYPRESFQLATKMTIWVADKKEDVERIMDPHTYIGSAEIIVDEILESSKDWF